MDSRDVELRLLLGRSLMALRRDAEAQSEVAQVLKLRPRCPEAYQLLGELAFRRDELNAAEIFFREALRIQGKHAHTQVLLDVVMSLKQETRTRPAAAAAKLPAASAAAGPFRKRVALGSDAGVRSEREAIARAPGPEQVALKVAGREGGFGEYLVRMGVLTRTQLFAVLHRHYHENLRIGDACVKLGFAREAEIEHHLAAYHDR